jgi:hypothetical protein
MNRLTVALFTTTDADFASVLQPYLDGANAMLAPYSMAIEVFTTGGTGTTPRKLPYIGPVFDGPGDPGTVRQQAHTVLPVGRGIPVIFCKRQTDDAKGSGFEYGSTIQTKSEANNGIGWPPYILINTQLKSATNEVLLHEMIHAAYGELQPKPNHDTDKSSAFYDYGTDKDGNGGSATRKLPQKHADALRKAYFCTFVP